MRTVLAVAALLVTAGCAGVAPTDSVQAPAPEAGYPPGVSESGLQNASRLVDAHVAALGGDSYAFTFEHSSTDVERTEPRQVLNYSARVTGRSNGSALQTHANLTGTDVNGVVVLRRFALRTDADSATSATWSMGEAHVQRVTEGDGDRYFAQFEQRPSRDGRAPHRAVLEALLSERDFALAGREVQDGETVVVLEPRAPTTDADETVAVDGRVVVDLAGRIRDAEVTYRRHVDQRTETETVDYRLSVREVGDVPRPAWTADAKRALDPSLDLEEAFGGGYLRIDHHGGDTLPPNSTFVVTHDGATYRLTVDERFGSTQSRYVAFPENGSKPVLSVEEPWRDYSALTGVYELRAFGPDGLPATDGDIAENASFSVSVDPAVRPESGTAKPLP